VESEQSWREKKETTKDIGSSGGDGKNGWLGRKNESIGSGKLKIYLKGGVGLSGETTGRVFGRITLFWKV